MSITRINNKQDPIPDLPPREFFEYHHLSSEIHIRDNDSWVACPGTSQSKYSELSCTCLTRGTDSVYVRSTNYRARQSGRTMQQFRNA